uniref:Uncharacterized protein n=1 Tax=Escherichia coli TaxID=562 RepID=A0A890DH32_ECOLX|nr:hypothetical protein [Escherichia coli]
MSVVRAEVLVEGFPADVELAGKLRLGLAGRRSLPQGSSLLIGALLQIVGGDKLIIPFC